MDFYGRTALIKAKDIKFSYRDSPNFQLQCCSFNASPSKLTCVIGGNGSGKSTLLKVLCGLVSPYAGSIHLNNILITEYTTRSLHRLVGWIDSSISLSLVENLYVNDHFAVSLLAAGKKIPLFYRYLDINSISEKSYFYRYLSALKDKQIANLSAGQRQNLTIALTFILSKKIILADEGTSNLDIYHSRQFFTTMQTIAENRSATVVVVTHDILLASEFADRLYFVKNGIVERIDCDKEHVGKRIKICKSIIINE